MADREHTYSCSTEMVFIECSPIIATKIGEIKAILNEDDIVRVYQDADGYHLEIEAREAVRNSFKIAELHQLFRELGVYAIGGATLDACQDGELVLTYVAPSHEALERLWEMHRKKRAKRIEGPKKGQLALIPGSPMRAIH